MAEVAVALKSIVENWNIVGDSMSIWCGVAGELKDYDSKMESLKQQHKEWEDGIRDYGLSDDEELRSIIDGVRRRLDAEQTRLCGGLGISRVRFWLKVKWTLFPGSRAKDVENVTKAFDDILVGFDNRNQVSTTLQRFALDRCPTLGFREDRRYVRLEKTNDKVMEALRDSKGPPVILLYGAPGKGKSSLARDVALQFQREIDQSTGTSNIGRVFEQVLFLECGSEVTLENKKLELIGKLKRAKNIKETALLRNLLKERQLLIVLDDVWKSEDKSGAGCQSEESFLQSMVEQGGERVKWLVTSRSGDLCKPLNFYCCSIGMENLNIDVARKILAGDIGLEESASLLQVKGSMDRIIEKVDGNPLALTCISSAISPEDYEEETEWKRVENELLYLLDSNVEIRMQSTYYGKSYWEAIQLGFDRLTKTQQNLLILLHMCKGPSVSAEVIEYLAKHIRDPNCYEIFSKARGALKDREFVTITDMRDNEVSGPTKSWSMHDLMKQFIRRKYFSSNGNSVSKIQTLSNIGIMFGEGTASKMESKTLSVLVSLYFDEDFRGEFGTANGEELDIQPCTPQIADSRREVIDPIARLLLSSERDQWTSKLCSSIQKTCVRYITEGIMDDVCSSELLDSPETQISMLATLLELEGRENHPFIGQKVANSVLRLLESQSRLVCIPPNKPSSYDRLLLYGIAIVFRTYGVNKDECGAGHLIGAGFRRVLKQLKIGLARVDDNPASSISSADVLGVVASARCVHIISEISNFHELLNETVRALQSQDHPELQENAACLIYNLAGPHSSDDIRLRFVRCRGLLDALVAGLGPRKIRGLQTYSAGALANLATIDNGDELDDVLVMMSGSPQLLQNLVTLMKKKDFPDLQEEAIRAIGRLALSNEVRSSIIAHFPEVPDVLVAGLESSEPVEIQIHSATALTNLAAHDQIRDEMGDTPQLLENLVTAMNKDCPDLQENATSFIHNLTLSVEMQVKIMDYPDVLDALAEGLGNGKTLQLQSHSAKALAQLASIDDDDYRENMCDTPELLKNLVTVLQRKDCPDLQEDGLRAISNLVMGGDRIRTKMLVNFPKILDFLVDAMAKGEDLHDGIRDGMMALTLLSPVRAKEMHLDMAEANFGRGFGEFLLGLYKDCLEDLDRYEANVSGTLEQNSDAAGALLSLRCCAKAKLGDLQGALADANSVVGIECALAFPLQERGVVKRMLGDLPGALADLDASLRLEEDVYEALKQRGFVKFLLNDEEGARADAERALSDDAYTGEGRYFLGGSAVQYLDFELE